MQVLASVGRVAEQYSPVFENYPNFFMSNTLRSVLMAEGEVVKEYAVGHLRHGEFDYWESGKVRFDLDGEKAESSDSED
mgnify:CR=1 FL=1